MQVQHLKIPFQEWEANYIEQVVFHRDHEEISNVLPYRGPAEIYCKDEYNRLNQIPPF